MTELRAETCRECGCDIQVIPPGTKVVIDGETDGVIERVTIAESLVPLYEVQWWNGRESRSAWFFGSRIECETAERLRIGFK